MYYEDDGIRECHQEIRRLRGVIREQYEELQALREENEKLKNELPVKCGSTFNKDAEPLSLKRIEIFDNIETNAEFEDVAKKYCKVLISRYYTSIERGNNIIDMYNFCSCDVTKICTSCRALGIERIAVSSRDSEVVKLLGLFIEQGCRVVGSTTVNRINDTASSTVPALVIEF